MMLNLILSSAQSIVQVMATVLFGYILTKAGYIKSDKQKWLSELNMVFFTPCLLFANIASVISFEKLLAFWPIPIFNICFAAFPLLASFLVSRAVGVKREYRPFVLACSMFHNTNSLPIAVITSLAVSEAGKILYWGADDTQQAVAARGITYVLLYAIFDNLLRWSYGYSLLQPPTLTKGDDDDEELQRGESIATTGDYYYGGSSDNDNDNNQSNMDRCTSTITLSTGPDPMYPKPTETTGLLSSFPTLNDGHDARNGDTLSSHSLWSVVVSIVLAVHQTMTPPLYAVCVALLVGLTPPLKYLMYESFLYPTVTSAIQASAKASVPITLLGLGSHLSSMSHTNPAGEETNKKAVATTIGIRMGLLPFIIIPAVVAFLKFGTRWSLVASDPVFGVVMIVLGCTPTAINLAQISQVTGAFENEMLRVLFWSYAVFCVPVLTLVIFAALSVAQHFT